MSTSLRRSILTLVLSALTLVAPRTSAAFEVLSGQFKNEDRTIVAGSSGVALLFASGLTLELSAGARLRQHKDTDLWMATTGKTTTEVFSLAQGRVRVLRPAREGKKDIGALVRTSRKLMGVTANGEFLAIAAPDEGIVASYQGTTLLSLGASWVKVPAGQYGKVTKTLPKVATFELPKAPALRASRSLWMSLEDAADIDGLSWSKGSPDERFRVTVTRMDSGDEVAAVTSSHNELGADALKLGPGMYQARVQSLNAYGLIGPYSEPVGLRVVGVKTHRGARVDGRGTLHLAANQRAEFLNVEGLLMAYGTGSRWAPATASVPIRDNEPVLVHFREQNSADMVSARLEPRGVVAEVHVGSKLAQWPGDTVQVVVKLKAQSGELTDSALSPHFEATLGIEPLQLQWVRQGATWRTTIPPHSGPGPWVIRVAVTDEHGVELGRDFLEVAERPRRSKLPLQSNGLQSRPVAHAP